MSHWEGINVHCLTAWPLSSEAITAERKVSCNTNINEQD